VTCGSATSDLVYNRRQCCVSPSLPVNNEITFVQPLRSLRNICTATPVTLLYTTSWITNRNSSAYFFIYKHKITACRVSCKLFSLRFNYTSCEISKKTGCSKNMYTSRMPITDARIQTACHYFVWCMRATLDDKWASHLVLRHSARRQYQSKWKLRHCNYRLIINTILLSFAEEQRTCWRYRHGRNSCIPTATARVALQSCVISRTATARVALHSCVISRTATARVALQSCVISRTATEQGNNWTRADVKWQAVRLTVQILQQCAMFWQHLRNVFIAKFRSDRGP
jgi:hypothetical protein